MKHGKASRTAGHVAALRGLGVLLPPSARLIDDPWGAEWTGYGRLRRLAAVMPGLAQRLSRPMWRWLLYMQVRTYALDQEVVRFAESGGRQLVLLGAGLDARAQRLRHPSLRVFEVDHPATQAKKRRLAEARSAGVPPASLHPSSQAGEGGAGVEERAGRPRSQGHQAGGAATFVPWDFEHDPVDRLPQRLCDLGYRRNERGCVLWEGVTMYLSEAANAATFAMLADLLAPDSAVAFTYFAKGFLSSRARRDRLMRRFVASHGEPWIFGWEPDQLPAWLAARGFAIEHDDSTAALAARWLPPDLAARVKEDERRIVLARRMG